MSSGASDRDERVIRVSAVVMRDPAGRLLTVRKRGTDMFMFPGGKPEPGESPAQTAVREIAEELGVRLEASLLDDLGQHSAPAANEAGFTVISDVFEHPYVPIEGVAAEIEELRWIAPDEDGPSIAPLTVQLLPLLAARRAKRSAGTEQVSARSRRSSCDARPCGRTSRRSCR